MERIGSVRPGVASTITTKYREFKVNLRRIICVHQYKLSLRIHNNLRGPPVRRAWKNRPPHTSCARYCQLLWMRFDSGGVLYLDPVDEFSSRNYGLEVG